MIRPRFLLTLWLTRTRSRSRRLSAVRASETMSHRLLCPDRERAPTPAAGLKGSPAARASRARQALALRPRRPERLPPTSPRPPPRLSPPPQPWPRSAPRPSARAWTLDARAAGQVVPAVTPLPAAPERRESD